MDLFKISGLPIREESNSLFSGEMPIPNVDIRTIDQARDVLLEKVSEPKELYYMYRCTEKEGDKDIFKKHNLRYDITIIPALKVGKEYNKTVGHYHAKVPGETLSYPEIYEVLQGKAHYLLQKVNFEQEPQQAVDILLVEALPGEKIIIPPDYGHVTINPGPETLVMANILADDFSSIYIPYAKVSGAVYYETHTGELIKNNNYDNLGEIIKVKPIEFSGFNLNFNKPMYTSSVENPDFYEYLTKPQLYVKEFEDYFGVVKSTRA